MGNILLPYLDTHCLYSLTTERTRSISPENFTGEPGQGGRAVQGTGAIRAEKLGIGWKISPSINVPAHTTVTLATIAGPGIIRHIWLTYSGIMRSAIFRMYWDDENDPSVETPLGDFFCNGWNEGVNVNSLPIVVNPRGGLNSYWEMPFRHSARITLENLTDEEETLYYQIDYALRELPDEFATFHASFRRRNPLGYLENHIILDHARGQGNFCGVYMAFQPNNNGWWGEGEVKFYLDGDSDFPSICTTGTEDYFGGAWNWEEPLGQYKTYSTPFLGMHQLIQSDGLYQNQQRFGMYRWHIPDPIRFQQELHVTIQSLGWRYGKKYLPQQGDIATTAFWYQTEPHRSWPKLDDFDVLEVI